MLKFYSNNGRSIFSRREEMEKNPFIDLGPDALIEALRQDPRVVSAVFADGIVTVQTNGGIQIIYNFVRSKEANA